MKVQVKTLRELLNGKLSIQEAKKQGLIGEGTVKSMHRLLTEEVPNTSATDPTMLENDSLDSQVDRFLMQGESDKNTVADGGAPAPTPTTATAPAGVPEARYHSLDLRSLLSEAPGDDPNAAAGAPAPAAGAVPDAGGDAPAEPPPEQPEQKSGRALDAVTFAENVARLVEKHESLLDLRGTIVRRALNWVTKNYDAKQSKEVAQILEGNFGITPQNDADNYSDDEAPRAAQAGPGLNA